MEMKRFRWRTLPGLMAVLLGLGAVAADWETVEVEGESYVTASSAAEFFRLVPKGEEGDRLTMEAERVRVILTAGSAEVKMNGLVVELGHPVIRKEKSFLFHRSDVSRVLDPVMRPTGVELDGKVETVVLDPGEDQGPALKVAEEAKRHLEREGYEVRLVSPGDELPKEGAVFVGVRFGGANAGAGLRSEVLGLPDAGETWPGNAQDKASMALAVAIHGTANSAFGQAGRADLGLRQSDSSLLRELEIPAMLVIGGDGGDSEDGKWATDPGYQQVLGRAIARGVKSFAAAVTP